MKKDLLTLRDLTLPELNEIFALASKLKAERGKVNFTPLTGKSIGALKFWQSTGGTIVAIRRGQTVILSPGPYAELYGGDVIVLVGSPAAAEAAHRLVQTQVKE